MRNKRKYINNPLERIVLDKPLKLRDKSDCYIINITHISILIRCRTIFVYNMHAFTECISVFQREKFLFTSITK